MEKGNKSPFLIAMAALGLVAVGGFFVLVLPAKAAASKKEDEINKKVVKITQELATLPGDPNIEAWSKNADELKKRYRDRLTELQQFDQALGEWFEGLDDSTIFAVFMNTYDDQRGKLQEELLDKGILLGAPNQGVETGTPGFNWILKADIERAVRTGEDERQAKEMLQKRFNICRAIVNALTAGYVKNPDRPRRLLDVTFLERFKFLPPGVGPNPEAAKSIDIVIEPKRYQGFVGIGAGAFAEQLLPFNGDRPETTETAEDGTPKPADASTRGPNEISLGRTITVGFAVIMEYKDVPDLVHKLIDPKVDPRLNLSIVGLNVFVANPNPTEKRETKVLQEGENEADFVKKLEEQSEKTPPPLVHVYVTCQVFDLDPAAVPAFLRP